MDAEMAAAAARLSVLEGSSVGGRYDTNGMNSYVGKGLKEQNRTVFNPKLKEFVSKPNVTAQLSSTAPPAREPDVRSHLKSYAQEKIQHNSKRCHSQT